MAERRQRLDEAYQLQKFLADYRDIVGWIELMKTAIGGEELAKDVASAEILLERHQEHKGEIDAREDAFQAAEAEGRALMEAEISVKEVCGADSIIIDLNPDYNTVTIFLSTSR